MGPPNLNQNPYIFLVSFSLDPKTLTVLSVLFISEQQHSTSSNGSISLSSSVFKRAQIFPLEFIDVSNTLGKGAYGKVNIQNIINLLLDIFIFVNMLISGI